MPTPCYISIEGKTQGNITAGAFTSDSVGNIFVQGHEDEMLVQEFQHVVTVPTDPQSGQPAGQRVHKPFKFTVALNKAVPLMYNSLASGEMLPKVTLKWYRTSVEGKQEHFFSTVLTDATWANLQEVGPPVYGDAAKAFAREIQSGLGLAPMDDPFAPANTRLTPPAEFEAGMRHFLPPWQMHLSADDYVEFCWHCPTVRLLTCRSDRSNSGISTNSVSTCSRVVAGARPKASGAGGVSRRIRSCSNPACVYR